MPYNIKDWVVSIVLDRGWPYPGKTFSGSFLDQLKELGILPEPWQPGCIGIYQV